MPEIKPGWAATSLNVVRIGERLSLDAEPTGRTFIDRLRVGVSDLIRQAVAVSLVYFDLQSVVAAVADTAIIESRRDVREWRSCLRISWAGRQGRVEGSADVEPPGAG